jgi:hypothetical protein
VSQTVRLTVFSNTRINGGITGHEGHEDHEEENDRDQYLLRVFVGFVFFVAKKLLVTQMLLKAVAPGVVLRVLRFLR